MPVEKVGTGDVGESELPQRATLVIPGKGPPYLWSWVTVIFFGVIAVLAVVTTGNVIVFGVVFGAFALLGIAGVLFFRAPRTFEADVTGMRLFHGRRLVRDVPWTEVRRFRYGSRPVPLPGRTTRPGSFLTLSRKGLHWGFDFDTQDYFDLEGDVAAFSERAAALAESRGVRTQRKELRLSSRPLSRKRRG